VDFSLTFLRNDIKTAVLLSEGKWGVKKKDGEHQLWQIER